MCVCMYVCVCMCVCVYLVSLYGIPTIFGYLMPNLAFTYVLNIWLINRFFDTTVK